MISVSRLSWIGGIFLAIALFFFVREQSFLSGAETASGKVTGLMASSSSSSGGGLCPVIQFSTSDGQKVEYYGNICTSPPFWRPGDVVEVVYDPQNLDKVQIKNILSQYLLVLILTIFGVVCLALWAWARTLVKKENGAAAVNGQGCPSAMLAGFVSADPTRPFPFGHPLQIRHENFLC
jgi:hypothetical protein